MVVVINPGHVYNGEGDIRNTKGKCSPDRTLIEAVWNYDVSVRVDKILTGNKVECVIAKATDEKVSLTYPVKICNDLCAKVGSKNVIFVSIHCNAQSNGNWGPAQGWSIWTTKGETNSDKLATIIYNRAKEILSDRKIRTDYSDKDPDYESNFYVIKKTQCVAVLVENFFMDNKEECEFLKTEDCKNRCAQVIAYGILDYIKSMH